MPQAYETEEFINQIIFNPILFQRQGVDISETDRQSGKITDSEMIKVEKSDSTNGENPFGGDDEDDDDEW